MTGSLIGSKRGKYLYKATQIRAAVSYPDEAMMLLKIEEAELRALIGVMSWVQNAIENHHAERSMDGEL